MFAVDELTTEVLQQALRAGARDAVVLGGEASLHQSVDRVGELLSGATTRAPAPATRTGEPGRLIIVFSTKGGVGKTCVAINVAAAMAKRSTEPVVLVDGDLQFGDVSVMLGLPPQNTVLDAAAAVQYGDMELVQTLATKDEASGLLVLPAPVEPMPTDAMMPGEMVNICAALQSIAGHVIVDLPSLFNDYVLALLEAADEVLLVGSMDIPSIKNLKIGMQTLDLHAIAGPKLRLVLNHANAKVKLDVKEIERVLGLSANFPVPDDIAVPMSVNSGRPVVLDDPKSPVSRALERIAESFLGPKLPQPKKRSRGANEPRRVSHDADATAGGALAGAAGRAGCEPARAPARGDAPEDAPVRDPRAGPAALRPAGLGGRAPASGRRAVAPRAQPGAPRPHRRRAPGSSCSRSPTTCSATARSTAAPRRVHHRSHGERPEPRLRRAARQARASTDVKFVDETHLRRIIDKIVSQVGRRVDEANPMVDARLPDGSRVNVVVHPLSIGGPFMTIRKFAKDPYTVDDLINFGSFTPQVAHFIDACVRGRLNIVVSGGTGTGKTTLLNVLSPLHPERRAHRHRRGRQGAPAPPGPRAPARSAPANIEGKGEVKIRDLVRNSLRMRPDRIVVGEVRGGEALDMLQAMNTGHDGSITTVHSNSPRDTLSRIETMTLMAGMDLPVRVIREQMASALDLIVHLTRLRDGTRRVTHVSEVMGMEGDVVVLQDIYTFDFAAGHRRGRPVPRRPQEHRHPSVVLGAARPTTASRSSRRCSPNTHAGRQRGSTRDDRDRCSPRLPTAR